MATVTRDPSAVRTSETATCGAGTDALALAVGVAAGRAGPGVVTEPERAGEVAGRLAGRLLPAWPAAGVAADDELHAAVTHSPASATAARVRPIMRFFL